MIWTNAYYRRWKGLRMGLGREGFLWWGNPWRWWWGKYTNNCMTCILWICKSFSWLLETLNSFDISLQTKMFQVIILFPQSLVLSMIGFLVVSTNYFSFLVFQYLDNEVSYLDICFFSLFPWFVERDCAFYVFRGPIWINLFTHG